MVQEEVLSPGVVVLVHSDADLTLVRQAIHSPRRFTRHLHGGQQQRDQHADHGDHDQQFNDREAGGARSCRSELLSSWRQSRENGWKVFGLQCLKL